MIASQPLRLDQLEHYSLLTIFDSLDLRDYYSIAALNDRFHQLIVDHYMIGRHHFNEREITITINEWCTIRTAEMQYLADGCDETLLVLEKFGEVFHNFKIQFNSFGNTQSRKIINAFGKYGKNVDLSIVIQSIAENTLNNWKFQLENVKSVAITATRYIDQMRLIEFFPNIEELSLQCNEMPVIGYHFPNLTKFHIFTFTHDLDISSNSQLFTFLHFNPQLRDFSTPFFNNNHSYINFVNEMLPNLHTLAIHDISANDNPTNEIVVFKNVKSYTFAMDRLLDRTVDIRNKVPSIQFECLESLTFSTSLETTHAYDHLIEVIGQYNTVKSLNLAWTEFTQSQFALLVQSLPELEKLVLAWKQTDTSNAFFSFLDTDESHKRLNFVKVTFHNQPNVDELVVRFASKWTVVLVKSYLFSHIVEFRRVSCIN